MPHHTDTTSFLPTTRLILIDYMSDALINTEYSQMKDFAGNTNSMTPLKGTPSGSRTRSKTSTAAPGGKIFVCDQNLELPLFLRPVFAKFFPSLEKF